MFRRRNIVGVITLSLAMSGLAPLPAALSEPVVIPVSAVASTWPGVFDARTWCRPVVNAAIDPEPLTCWLMLASEEFPPGLPGTNFGDLPAWADVDVEEIEAELTRYAEALEAERRAAEAERRASPASRRGRATTPTTGPGGSGVVEWEEPEQYDPFSPDYEPDWDEDPNGGFYGVENDIPPMPDECNGGLYDSRWGWTCA